MNDWRQLRCGFYAPDGAGGGTPEEGTQEQQAKQTDSAAAARESQAQEEKTEKMLSQSEVQRIINRTIAEERAKAEKLAKQARTEGEKLASMSAEERVNAEAEARVADILAREQEITQREADIMRRELRAAALDTLAQKGLPAGLADLLTYTGADECQESIEKAEKVFRQSVQQGIDDRLRAKELPKVGGGGEAVALTAAMRAAAGLPPAK